MNHIVLIGDSIFDNARYVPGEDPVYTQLQKECAGEVKVTLCAVDGDVTTDVPGQVERIPDDATHLFLSVGGNDALGWVQSIKSAGSAQELLNLLMKARDTFAHNYETAILSALGKGLPLVVCTIYDAVPDLERQLLAPLGVFNDIITGTAARHGIPVIDLRTLCRDTDDYSSLSPIEPSARGGLKIVKAIDQAYRRTLKCVGN